MLDLALDPWEVPIQLEDYPVGNEWGEVLEVPLSSLILAQKPQRSYYPLLALHVIRGLTFPVVTPLLWKTGEV